jgi:hypothetical protein
MTQSKRTRRLVLKAGTKEAANNEAALLFVLSQKVARFDFENQVFEKIQDWRARC